MSQAEWKQKVDQFRHEEATKRDAQAIEAERKRQEEELTSTQRNWRYAAPLLAEAGLILPENSNRIRFDDDPDLDELEVLYAAPETKTIVDGDPLPYVTLTLSLRRNIDEERQEIAKRAGHSGLAEASSRQTVRTGEQVIAVISKLLEQLDKNYEDTMAWLTQWQINEDRLIEQKWILANQAAIGPETSLANLTVGWLDEHIRRILRSEGVS